ncbi:hypothetical protein ANCCAN_03762 [Ancylostoma caninum]|uniref:Uncharacterized protein n=1 Tax=Ancylostoma caninum TaxID=29170 RepID=A0A368H4I2_ANCCA|nr:hypothetical protein ANCCAN_03762 [Ancylostoma caninum]
MAQRTHTEDSYVVKGLHIGRICSNLFRLHYAISGLTHTTMSMENLFQTIAKLKEHTLNAWLLRRTTKSENCIFVEISLSSIFFVLHGSNYQLPYFVCCILDRITNSLPVCMSE